MQGSLFAWPSICVHMAWYSFGEGGACRQVAKKTDNWSEDQRKTEAVAHLPLEFSFEIYRGYTQDSQIWSPCCFFPHYTWSETKDYLPFIFSVSYSSGSWI